MRDPFHCLVFLWFWLSSDLHQQLFSRSKLYMADLESALHYLFRIELATHRTLEGAALKTFKDFVTILAKVKKK